MSQNRSYWIYLLLLIVFSQSAKAQVNKDVVFDHLTIQNGLSHSSVNVLLQDKYGYIWIGTQNGLNRYNGQEFLIYNSEKACSGNCFRGKSIECLLEDSKGNLWVGTRDHGINLKNSTTDRFINIDSIPGVGNIEGYDISELYEDLKGNIWIGILNIGLVKFDPIQETYKLYNSKNSGLLREQVFEVLEASNGDVYVKTSGYGLHILGKNDQFEQIHVDRDISPNMDGYRSTMQVESDFLWIGMEGTGLYKMNLNNRHFTHYTNETEPIRLESNAIRDILLTKDGKFYIATDGGGLGVFDDSRQKLIFFKAEDENDSALNSNAVQCLMEDNDGNIWIGTFNGGINIIKKNRPRFEKINPIGNSSKMTKYASVLSLMQAKDKSVWIGTDGEGLVNYNLQNRKRKRYINDPSKSSLRGNVIKSIFEAPDEKIWSGTFSRGINIQDIKSDEFTSVFGYDFEYQNIWTIEEDKSEKIWIGTIGDGIYIVEDDGIIEHHKNSGSFPDSPASNDIMVIFKDDNDKMWIGNAKEGLDLWNEEERTFRHFVHDPSNPQSISDNEIRSIFQDSKGTLWIGTEGGGLNKMNSDETFSHFGVREGLIADNILAIEEDDFGFLWMSSFTGISRFNPETNEVLNYSFRSEDQSNQFNQESILKDHNGLIYFGGINGIDVVDPKMVKKIDWTANILFSEFRIFDQVIHVNEELNNHVYLRKPIEETEEIRLYHKDKAFTLSLATNDFVSLEEEPIQYLLKGFNESWQNVKDGKHSISYTNLDFGRYRLYVKYKDSVVSMKIHMVAPYWKTWWFRIGMIIIILSIISYFLSLVHFRRLDQEKQKLLEKEKELLETKNVSLEENVNVSNSKLLSSTAQMAHKNEILLDIKQDLSELQKNPNKNIRSVIRKVNIELKNEDYWEEFNIYFDKVDKKFTDEILRIHPDLTQNDLKICTFIRLNMNTKDIASLLNISVRGVEKGRYRLKKRLELTSEQDLIQYIRSIHPNEVK